MEIVESIPVTFAALPNKICVTGKGAAGSIATLFCRKLLKYSANFGVSASNQNLQDGEKFACVTFGAPLCFTQLERDVPYTRFHHYIGHKDVIAWFLTITEEARVLNKLFKSPTVNETLSIFDFIITESTVKS